jgi:hypothetical protein
MAHDVFLSYSYQDKTSADAVCHSLEAKGVRCWIAPRDVIPGEDWQQSILDAIAESRAVILLFTGHTNQSENVKKEVSAAFDSNSMVIPFLLEDVKPQGSLKYHLIGVHWLDAYAPPLEEHVAHLAKIIQNLPAKDGEDPPPPAPIPIPMPPPLPSPPPPPAPEPRPGPDAGAPTSWDAVSLDRREGFAFLAAIIPFAPGFYLLWRGTYRNDGDKVAPVSPMRKAVATALAVLVIIPVLLVAAQLLKGHGGGASDLSSSASSSAESSSAASSAISASPAESAAPAAAAWTGASTDSSNRELKFVNQSTHAVYHIFAWPTGQTEGDGHDLMGPEVISVGQTATYKVDDGQNHCDYSFKITRADNAPPVYISNFGVCRNEQLLITDP